MPFRGTLRARLLELLGSGGLRIIGATDPPRFEFYSGLPSEVSPGLIRIEPIPGANEVAMLLLAAPELNGTSGPASLLLISREDGTRDALLNLETFLMDPGAGDAIIGSVANRLRLQNQGTASEIDLQNDGDIVFRTPGGAMSRYENGVRLEAGLGFTDSGETLIGGAIFGIDMGSSTAATFNGDGSLNIPHNFGHTNFRAIGSTQSGGGARWVTRTPASDTNSNIRFRVWNDAGGNPANGTNVTVEWIAVAFS